MQESTEGFHWRERLQWEREAWFASILLHAWVPNAPSPQQLLGDVVTDDPEAALEALVEGDTPERRLARLDMILAAQPRREKPL